CVSNGSIVRDLPLWWAGSCVGYSVQRDASARAPLPDVTEAAARAFGVWTRHPCSSVEGAPRASIELHDLGPVACAEVGYHSDRANQNLVVFRDDAWPHRSESEVRMGAPSPTIALTTVSFDPTTGEIYDADIEINSADHVVALNGTPSANVYDLESVLLHE